LLITELALRAYELQHGTHPQVLDELVPNTLPSLLSDPYDPKGNPFRYRRDGANYVLYRVGPDGVDDGGRSLNLGENGNVLATSVGDLRLNLYFAQIEQIEENNKQVNGDGSTGADPTANGENADGVEK
jgi:hypothetical protein